MRYKMLSIELRLESSIPGEDLTIRRLVPLKALHTAQFPLFYETVKKMYDDLKRGTDVLP